MPNPNPTQSRVRTEEGVKQPVEVKTTTTTVRKEMVPNPNPTATTTRVDDPTVKTGFVNKETGSNASLARSGQSTFPGQSYPAMPMVEDEFQQQVENLSEPEDDPELEERLVREGKLQRSGQGQEWFSLPIDDLQRKQIEDDKRHFAEDVQQHETELEAEEEFADLDTPTRIKMKQKVRSGMESAKENIQEGMRKIKQKTMHRDHVRDSPEARLKQGDVRRHAEDVQQQQLEDETRHRA
eukprot:m.83717 g.83717  ORF g.83717 m.83717 type:complete len:239 (+) comp14356_c1_seq1:359-1075(+)